MLKRPLISFFSIAVIFLHLNATLFVDSKSHASNNNLNNIVGSAKELNIDSPVTSQPSKGKVLGVSTQEMSPSPPQAEQSAQNAFPSTNQTQPPTQNSQLSPVSPPPITRTPVPADPQPVPISQPTPVPQPEPTPKPILPDPPKPVAKTYLTISGGKQSQSFEVEFQENMTAWDQLSRASNDNNFSVETRMYGDDVLVESIAGYKNNQKTGKYWFLYIKGEFSKTGASSVVLQPDDKVEWKYQ